MSIFFLCLRRTRNLEKRGHIRLEELLRVMDYTEEQRVKYAAYKFSGEARRWWYAKRNSLVMELGSEEAITWTRFKEEFY